MLLRLTVIKITSLLVGSISPAGGLGAGPPEATLRAAGQEQQGGFGAYCWADRHWTAPRITNHGQSQLQPVAVD